MSESPPDLFDEPKAQKGVAVPLPRGDASLVPWAQNIVRQACEDNVQPLRVAALVEASGGSFVTVAAATLCAVLAKSDISTAQWPCVVTDLVLRVSPTVDQTILESVERLHDAPEEALLIQLAIFYDMATVENTGRQPPEVLRAIECLLSIITGRGLKDSSCKALYKALASVVEAEAYVCRTRIVVRS